MTRLPPEICDHIVDLLHDEPETLIACCLVSKSWVPCARSHLFGEVAFRSLNDLKAWEATFPDPTNSPACYTCSLFITCEVITTAVLGGSGWIQAFSNVVRLSVSSAHESCSGSQLIKLVCSLPLLEDLDVACQVVVNHSTDNGNITQFSTSPPLTGTLKLDSVPGVRAILRQLLVLPNGIHFRTLECKLYVGKDDPRWIVATMEACSGTLESIHIDSTDLWSMRECSVDFSKTTRLKEVVFRLGGTYDGRTAIALKTLTSEHRDLQRISIHIPIRAPSVDDRQAIDEVFYQHWMDVDCALIRMWESNAIPTRVIYTIEGERKEGREYIGLLLPEMTKRGILEAVDQRDLV